MTINAVHNARLFLFEDGALQFPNADFAPDAEQADYCQALRTKAESSDMARTTRFVDGSDTFLCFAAHAADPLPSLAEAFARQFAARLARAGVESDAFDLLTFFADGTEEMWFCAFYLPYQAARINQLSPDGEPSFTQRKCVLPAAGAKCVAGVIVNLATCDVVIKDTPVQTGDGIKNLFSELTLDCQKAFSPAETMKTVRQIACDIAEAPFEIPAEKTDEEDIRETRKSAKKEIQAEVKRAIAGSIEETGTLDVGYVAQTIFEDEPELKNRFHERIEQVGIEPAARIESDRLRNSVDRVKFTTDTGVSIILSRRIADDASRFQVVNHPDGSISIEIKHVRTVREG